MYIGTWLQLMNQRRVKTEGTADVPLLIIPKCEDELSSGNFDGYRYAEGPQSDTLGSM